MQRTHNTLMRIQNPALVDADLDLDPVFRVKELKTRHYFFIFYFFYTLH